MIVFFALCAFVVALSAAEIPLTAKDFVLGNRTAGSVKYQVSFDDGVLTVMISPSPKIGNATLGAVLNIPGEMWRGMGVRFRGEDRYENIASDAGGPFWGGHPDGPQSLQIAESSQISPDDLPLMQSATHFNPVDLVCAVRDYKGHKFDLVKYVDKATGFIS